MKFYFLAMATGLVVCVGCTLPKVREMAGGSHIPKNTYTAPPAAMMQQPGPMVAGPGPGVLSPMVAAPQSAFVSKSTQIRFINPEGMQIGWQIPKGYAENQLMAPGRHNFQQGATYRLKLTNIPGHDGTTLYPTLQVYPSHPTTDAYLSHNSVPIELTDEDLDQVESNNYVTKVIYLPEAKFQELAIAGVETLVSTRLDPGVDPVAEADRRGTIMAVLRMGNMDMEGVQGIALSQNSSKPGVKQVAYVDGEKDQFVEPMPISGASTGLPAIPGATIVAGSGLPGQPIMNPISGMGGLPKWGMPMTGTPIGLPGPPHLPYGGPAGLKSHTVRNYTKVNVGKPVDQFVLDVKHEPGYRLPKPVKHVKYSEKHPVYESGETSFPAYSVGQPQ